MRVTLVREDLTNLSTDESSIWALDPAYGDGDITMFAELFDSDGEPFEVEITMTADEVLGMVSTIQQWRGW